eukprot:3851611-Amphidinium_carterae.1
MVRAGQVPVRQPNAPSGSAGASSGKKAVMWNTVFMQSASSRQKRRNEIVLVDESLAETMVDLSMTSRSVATQTHITGPIQQ